MPRRAAPRIAVFGNINMDAVVRTATFPEPGQNRLGQSLQFLEGGKGSNQARAVARLGGRAVLVGRVGNDPFGDTLRANLAAEGVETRSVVVDARARTGMAFVFVTNAENRILSVLGANEQVTSRQVLTARSAVRSARIILVQLGIPAVAVDAVLQLGRSLGTPVVLDPAPIRGQLPRRWATADVLLPNESELRVLAGRSHRANTRSLAARVLATSNARVLVVKLGAKGCLVLTRAGQSWTIPPFRVRAVDPTGAGDAFAAAFAVATAEGAPPDRAARFATAAGALAATRLGAAPSLPTFVQLRRRFPTAVPPALTR